MAQQEDTLLKGLAKCVPALVWITPFVCSQLQQDTSLWRLQRPGHRVWDNHLQRTPKCSVLSAGFL